MKQRVKRVLCYAAPRLDDVRLTFDDGYVVTRTCFP